MNKNKENLLSISYIKELWLKKQISFKEYLDKVKAIIAENIMRQNIEHMSELDLRKLLNILSTWWKSIEKNILDFVFSQDLDDLCWYEFLARTLLDENDTFFFDFEEQRLFNKLLAEDRIILWSNTYLAPETLNKLFYNSKRDIEFLNLTLRIWKWSNIQEIRETICNFSALPIHIDIWNNSSIAHWVRFIVTKPSQDICFNIWDRVFVGIKTILENWVTIKSWEHNQYTSIWFWCKLEKWVKIWHRSIIWDGSIIKEWIEIPDDVAVLAWSTIDENTVNNIVSIWEYEQLSYEEKEIFCGMIKLNDSWKDREKIPWLDWVYKFLEGFNQTVLEENHLFPMLYSLIKKYHKDQYHIIQFQKWRAININLPKDINWFFLHYLKESIKVRLNPWYSVVSYEWDFTRVVIEPWTEIARLMYNIWDTYISGSYIYWVVINRSWDEKWNLILRDSIVHNWVVFHAKWEKFIFNSELHDKTTIHWKTTVEFSQIFDECLLHDSSVKSDCHKRRERTNVWARSTFVWANVLNSQFWNDVHILGHSWKVSIIDSFIWEKTHIWSKSRIVNSTIEWEINLWAWFNLENSIM